LVRSREFGEGESFQGNGHRLAYQPDACLGWMLTRSSRLPRVILER
jgi:hypothetical protein